MSIPLIVRAPLLGIIITAFGGAIWGILLGTNFATTPRVPWAVPAMAVVLWLLWKYLAGYGWPQSTSELRRSRLRANSVSKAAWTWAILGGVSGVIAMTGLWIVFGNLIEMPANQIPDTSDYPTYTLIPVLLMASLVAPITEESGFRGYAQVPLEKKYSPLAAILITSIGFSLAHLTHGAFPPKLFLYFLGGLIFAIPAYLTNSILPGIVIHVFADLTFFLLVWPNDSTRVLVTDGGADAWFWTHVAQVLAFGTLSIWAYRKLATPPQALTAP